MNELRTTVRFSVKGLSWRRRAAGLTARDQILLHQLREKVKEIEREMKNLGDHEDEELWADYMLLEELAEAIIKEIHEMKH